MQATDTNRGLVRALGWFSLGIGMASLLMPRTLVRSAGIQTSSRRGERWARAIGARELIAGAGLLMRPDKPGWLWSRVAGDAMDLALLALATRHRRAEAGRRLGLLSAALTGITVLDVLLAWNQTARLAQLPSATRGTRGTRGALGALGARGETSQVRKSLDVNRSPEECYRFWRHVENFPRFMPQVERVEPIDSTHWRWQLRGRSPDTLGQQGPAMHWQVELIRDIPGQQLGWQARSGDDLTQTSLVRFSQAPGHRGTRIEAEFTFHPTLGKAGLVLARLTGEEPAQQLHEDLRRFKQLIETGEIPTTIGQPAGQRSAIGRLIHKGLPG